MRRPTLGQTFLVATAAIALVVGLAFFEFLRHSKASILVASERLRESAARRIEAQVTAALGGAEGALESIERAIRSGAVRPDDLGALEVALYTTLIDAPHLDEVTFTGATLLGYDDKGDARLEPTGRFQLSVLRSADGRVLTRLVRQEADGFVVSARERPRGGSFGATPLAPRGAGADPTAHPTFSVIAARRNRGRAVWSDLHYSELDAGRVVLSVQKATMDASSHFAGVVRVGLLTTDLDAIARVKVDEANPNDPHRVALMSVSSSDASAARLVARVGADDKVVLLDDELRIVPDHPPKEIAALLSSPLVMGLDPEHPNGGGALVVDGSRYLATLRELSSAGGGTSGWFVAVLVPEAYYTADLVRFERTFLWVFGGTLFLVLAIGGLTLAAVRRGLGEVAATTARMRLFDFAASTNRSRLREIDDVMLGLERAKTVVRAMGKYIPLGLVQKLYESNQEPELGGELAEVSLMFTDIEGFTTLSERLSPDELSRRLGDYLEAMTSAVQKTSGTIDKYIGDAVMAFWNAPTRIEAHAAKACAAVLECKRATAALYASEVWKGLPALVTRYGLHEAKVMVGHFGARTRLSYTALGDGVNLAARLEPLCKQYGVTTLVSEAIALHAGDEFVFRRVDRVAVKGKTQGIDVYELLGRRGDEIPELERARRYEEAFDAYLELDFEAARAILESQLDDPPSAVLAERCIELRKAPPPSDWNRVHVARSK